MGNYGHLLFDAAFVIVGLGFIFAYAKRGFLKSILHFFKTILAFVIAYFFGGKLAKVLCDNWIGGAVRDFIYNKINGIYQGAAESFDADAVISSLPDFLMTEEMQANLAAAEGSGETLVNSMTDALSMPIASLISNILGYVGVFLIALIGLWIVAGILDKIVSHLPLLGSINTILGALLGLVIALAVLFAASSLIKQFFAESPIYTQTVIVKLFGESSMLEFLSFLNLGDTWFAELLGK
ncbi:MAG: CvpA family protein [Ruminococcaceae bacterium]|nr:CvpA family protein [Oscillospiraceae bacterium]